MRAIDVRHQGQEKVICCWEVDGVLIDPGPGATEETLLAALDGQRPRALLLTHIHFDHAGVVRLARAALAGPAGLRPRARRAAPGRPVAPDGLGRAPVRRRRGPARAVGRDGPAPGGEPARAQGRRDRRRGRVPRRVHARPRVPPRLLLPRAVALGVRGRRRRRAHPAARVHRRADAAAGHRRRGLEAARSPSCARGSPSRSASPTSARPGPSSWTGRSKRSTPRSSSRGRPTTRPASSRPWSSASAPAAARTRTRCSAATPLDQLHMGLARWRQKFG